MKLVASILEPKSAEYQKIIRLLNLGKIKGKKIGKQWFSMDKEIERGLNNTYKVR